MQWSNDVHISPLKNGFSLGDLTGDSEIFSTFDAPADKITRGGTECP